MKKTLNTKIYDSYVKLLEESINRNIVISEDTARYLFYANIISELKLSLNNMLDIQQELSYFDPKLSLGKKTNLLKKNKAGKIMAELDTYLDFGKEKYAIEFKYHREISRNKNKRTIPHSMYVGSVFNDINRLSLINSKINRYFVYITDSGMINYKRNDENCLYRKVFDLNNGESYIINQNKLLKQSKTTKVNAYSSFSKMNKGLSDIKVVMKYRNSILCDKREHFIAILEIV